MDSVRRRYGEAGLEVMNVYNPDFLFGREKRSEDCFFGDYPTLSELDRRYGKRFSAAWLMVQLHDLSEYCGCHEKLSGRKLQQCAIVMAADFCYLKVTEFLLFFRRFKSGIYGRFYGAVDPLVITVSLREFLNDRSVAIERHEQEERRREKDEWGRKAVSYEQYLLIRKLAKEGDEEAKKMKNKK